MYLYLVYFNQLKHEIFKYRYPRFSNFCFAFCILMIFLYDPAQILCALILVILFIFIINNPSFRRIIDPLLKTCFFREDLENPYSKLNVKSIDEFEDEQVINKVFSKKKKELKSEEAKKAKKLKKKEWIYNSLKRNYSSLLHWFMQASDLIEKFKKYFSQYRIVYFYGKTRRRVQ